MNRRESLCLLALVFATSAPFAAARAPVLVQASALVGTWDGEYEPPGVVGGDPFSLCIEAASEDAVRGTLVLPAGTAAFTGSFDAARSVLVLAAELEGSPLRGELALQGESLRGQASSGPWEWGIRAERVSPEVLARSHARPAVELAGKELPETFSLIGLETDVGTQLDDLLRKEVAEQGLVGLSIACVVDGALVDVRSVGWEDVRADVPASDQTRYRWASISKPLTSAATMRMVALGTFDLDADVRKLVPEFPDPGVVITAREILCHQSGITHYAGARRTWREYTSAHPFEQLVNGLDLFRESPLLFAPRTQSSYSTHAWTLLGVSLERAGKKPYAELVRELVLEPLGMRTTEPDHRSRAIPHRAKGYERSAAGELFESFDDDVSWKLPGGGWISTVGDLARFGAGLIGSQLLDESQKALLWTPQPLADGTTTEYGLGFIPGTLQGQRLISHSGGQRKASTFLAVLPERRLAVAVMCNTERAATDKLALAALRILLTAK